MTSWLRGVLGQQLSRDPDAIEADRPLSRYGLNSPAAAVTAELSARLDRELPQTL